MKKIFGFWNLMLLVTGSLFIVSCGDDTVDPIDNTTPTLTQTNNFDEGVEQDPTSEILITLKAVKGVGAIASLNVKENGSNLPISRFTVDGAEVASSTVPISGNDQQGFTKEVEIDLPTVSGTYTYLFTITDANQKTDEVAVEIKVRGVATITSDTLYNFAGPWASGLNLSTGENVSKNTDNNTWPGAHILDAGNNVNGDQYPWKGSITNYDGSVIRKVNSSNWDSTVGLLQLQSLFENSTDVAEAKLAVGDVYIVKKGSDYFMIKVKVVKDDGKNSSSGPPFTHNFDYSIFDIKK